MVPRLAASSWTFTPSRVRSILHCELQSTTNSWSGEFKTRDLCYERVPDENEDGGNFIRVHNSESRARRARDFCIDYVAQLQECDGHVKRLDGNLSEWLTCNFVLTDAEDKIAHDAILMLERLPAQAVPLPDALAGVLYQAGAAGACYCHPNTDKTLGTGWETLQVTNYVDRNVIRIALQIAITFVKIGDPEMSHSLKQIAKYLNTTVELLEAAHTLWKEATGYAAKLRGFLLVTFLWTSSHRALVLLLSYCLQLQLTIGFSDAANDGLNTPTFALVVSSTPDHPGMSPYMCKWAYELLRTDRSSIGLDFRTFHERYTEYAQQYGHVDPRCNRADDGHLVQCDGRDPKHCMRFVGQTITDQSAHVAGCAGYCSKMHWDEESYGKVSRGRAVLVDADTSDNRLRYCSTTEKTLTISHVRSHGQGGRPEITNPALALRSLPLSPNPDWRPWTVACSLSDCPWRHLAY